MAEKDRKKAPRHLVNGKKVTLYNLTNKPVMVIHKGKPYMVPAGSGDGGRGSLIVLETVADVMMAAEPGKLSRTTSEYTEEDLARIAGMTKPQMVYVISMMNRGLRPDVENVAAETAAALAPDDDGKGCDADDDEPAV